ncbi:MAG TPA: hypothetical protein VF192_00240 [Longimicrobiales bacterium]
MAVAVTMAALLAACSEDDPAGPGYSGDQLTEAEAEAVWTALVEVTDSARVGIMENDPPDASLLNPASAMPGNISFEHTSTHPCPVDGTVAVALNVDLAYDEEAESLDYDARGSLTHEECSFSHDSVTFTVDGDPNLSFAARVVVAEGVFEPITESVEGAFEWSASDGRSGRCIVDLSKVTDLTEGKRTLQGEVCGHTIEQEITWTT